MNEKNTVKSACLILCGGKSRRMKRDKARLLIHDESFLEILCAKIRQTEMPRYISLSDNPEQIPDDFRVLNDEVCDENGGFIGPLGGICTGLKQCAREGMDGIYTVPVDLPLFETELFDLIHQAMADFAQADIYVLQSSDGRVHPACGYYRTSALSAAKERIHAQDYRLMSLLRHPDLHTVYVKTENARQDRMLFNVNTPADYEALPEKTRNRTKHIVLEGGKGAGKSTLIRKLAEEMQCITGGYLSRAVFNKEKGCREIYICPASCLFDAMDPDRAARTKGKLCALTQNGVKEVYPEVFDSYGAQLIRCASDKQLIVMDEIGFLEEKAEQFKKAVLSALDGDIPVLAAIKAKDISSPFLETVRSHENVRLIEVNETNRDEVYEQVKKLYQDRKEGLL